MKNDKGSHMKPNLKGVEGYMCAAFRSQHVNELH